MQYIALYLILFLSVGSVAHASSWGQPILVKGAMQREAQSGALKFCGDQIVNTNPKVQSTLNAIEIVSGVLKRASGFKKISLSGTSAIGQLSLSSTGAIGVAAYRDGSYSFFNPFDNKGKAELSLQRGLKSVKWVAEHNSILSLDLNSEFSIDNFADGGGRNREKKTFSFAEGGYDGEIIVSGDSKWSAVIWGSRSSNTIGLLNLEQPFEINLPVAPPEQIDTEGAAVMAGAISPNQTHTILAAGLWNGNVTLFPMNSLNATATVLVKGRSNGIPVFALSFSPTGEYVAAGLQNGQAKVWRLESNLDKQILAIPNKAKFAHASQKPISKVLITRNTAKMILEPSFAQPELWDINEGKRIGKIKIPTHRNADPVIVGSGISKNDDYYWVATPTAVFVFDMKTFNLLHKYVRTPTSAKFTALDMSRGSGLIAASTTDGQIYMFDGNTPPESI